ncbi:MAG TPA: alpha/beta hydrolase [Actinoplanes sp.]|nr:alpha/beta hydrolase [Actinoplanes sp.]
MRRLWLTVTVAIGLLAASIPAGPGQAAAAASPAAPSKAVTWGSCPGPDIGRDPRQQCATVAVPLDYRKPRGRTIDVAISRVPAAPGQRRGILLTNPGGPGVPGLDLPSLLPVLFPAEVLNRYDVIGMDPRGVGASTPISCGISADTPLDLLLPYPAPDGSISRNVAFARSFAAGCAQHSGDLLPFITTANTARDMDVVRTALGERRLSFFGGSYGTYLGAVYATLFPRHTDRMVFDSAIDPRLVWRGFYRSWSEATALRLPDFTGWAAARDATYHLGATGRAVAGSYFAIAARLDRTPVTLPDGTLVNGNTFREYTRLQLTNDANFPGLAAGWRYFATGAGTAPVIPRFADNYVSVLNAIACNDTAWPRDPAVYARDVAVDRRLFPVAAGMPANIRSCAFWPHQPLEPPVRVTGRGPRNVLIVQNTRDPSTSWRNALGLRVALGRRAVLVTVNAGGHIALGRGTCADTAAARFLTTGRLPAGDQLCPGPQPDDSPPTGASAPAAAPMR